VSIRHCVTCKLTCNNFVFKIPNFLYVVTGVGFRQILFTPIFVHELRVITVSIDFHWKSVRVYCACAESHYSCAADQKQLHFWNPRPLFVYSLCNFGGSTIKIIKFICENNARPALKNVWVSVHAPVWSVKDALNIFLQSFSSTSTYGIKLQKLSMWSHLGPFSATCVLRMRRNGYLCSSGVNLDNTVRFRDPNFLLECKFSVILATFSLDFCV